MNFDNKRVAGLDIKGVCELLNIVLTKKNKSVADVSHANPLKPAFLCLHWQSTCP